MAGPWEKFAAPESGPWAKFQPAATPKETTLMGDIKQGAGNLVAGAVRGAGSIGATILAPYDMAKDALAGKGLSLESNRQRRADMDAGLQTLGAQPDSLLYQGGKLGGEIAGTAGMGGVLAGGVRAIAPGANALTNAIATSGMRAGAVPAGANWLTRAGNMGTRVAGGGITGAASTALISPEDAGTGAAIGAALPPVLAAAGRGARYVGNAAGSLVKPFTTAGQDEIAGNVVRRFAEGGPTAVNAAPIVPGSAPTLAEATGNAGLATLQRGTRDLRPNAFVEREATNAAARNTAFEQAAGDAGQLDFYKASRANAAEELYGAALNRQPEPLTPYIKGQVTQLLKRPSIDQASREAQKLAMERGEKPAAMGSLRALQDVKTILGDKIAEATQAGKGGQVKALKATQAKLVDVMEKLSPGYGEANATYAAMSQPVNAMESLQGLRLTDAQGNITLAKVQNALRGLESKMQAPGAQAEKSITTEQLGTLRAIRDDLLRQSNLGLGHSVGSNTFQNLATDNILNSFMGNSLTKLADKIGVPGLLGQAGRLAYSGPNEAIRNRLVDMMLQPQLATNALSGQPLIGSPNRLMQALTSPSVQQPIYQAAPVLAAPR